MLIVITIFLLNFAPFGFPYPSSVKLVEVQFCDKVSTLITFSSPIDVQTLSWNSVYVTVFWHGVKRTLFLKSVSGAVHSWFWCNISNTRKSVSSDIQTLRSGWKNEAQPSFFNQLRSVWISDETLFRVFDIASQSIDNFWRKSKQNFSEFYDN